MNQDVFGGMIFVNDTVLELKQNVNILLYARVDFYADTDYPVPLGLPIKQVLVVTRVYWLRRDRKSTIIDLFPKQVGMEVGGQVMMHIPPVPHCPVEKGLSNNRQPVPVYNP